MGFSIVFVLLLSGPSFMGFNLNAAYDDQIVLETQVFHLWIVSMQSATPPKISMHADTWL